MLSCTFDTCSLCNGVYWYSHLRPRSRSIKWRPVHLGRNLSLRPPKNILFNSLLTPLCHVFLHFKQNTKKQCPHEAMLAVCSSFIAGLLQRGHHVTSPILSSAFCKRNYVLKCEDANLVNDIYRLQTKFGAR